MDKVGKMRQRITVQTATVTRGELGGEVLMWTDSFTAFASVDFISVGSDEKFRAEQLTNRTAVNIMIRKEDRAISTRDRIKYSGLIYDIDSVLLTGDRHEFYLLECFQFGEQKTY